MQNKGTSTSSFFWRRKYTILTSLILFTILFFVIREKYFYRSDVLLAVPYQLKNQDQRQRMKVEIENEGSTGGIFSFFGFSSSKNKKLESEEKTKKMNVWDAWMLQHTEMTSIGEIFDKCDNKTRRKIGKVVLQPKSDGSGVQIKSFLNQTYTHEIVSSRAQMKVYFNDNLLYEKDKDMCEAAKDLDTPYSCPIKAGQTIVIEDVAKMPSYIPKGKYRVFSTVTDQNKKEIGCTYIEFKTGDEESE